MAEENQVIHCKTNDLWKEHFDKGKDSKKLVVVDFTASWCGPCRFIAPILADLAKKNSHVIFLKVDVDELEPRMADLISAFRMLDLQSVAKEWDVEAMPTFLFLKEGKIVDKIVGAKKEELVQTVVKHSVTAAA
ncbi:hypothetical protein TIFTF001_005420 [Ficus carica]|uniref:Thioredoxin domain-containing protein n=1 Tax=Ficus carica TaxID=3494 RepID=A0AA88DEP8_FICCA|nr:hypothetical protein TIFTF001_005420 [Ficus carica]